MKLAPWIRPASFAIGIVAVLGTMYYFMYARPIGRVQKELNAALSANNDLSAAIKDRSRVREALKDFAKTTIASTADGADARFRSLLTEIAVSSGLAKSSVQVNTTHAERVVNPGGSSKLATRLKDDLKKQVDFRTISGELTGVGPLEAALRTLATVKAQPWAHRIETFSIKPEDKDRTKFSLRLNLITLIVPDLAPADFVEPAVHPIADGGRGLWAGIVQKNVFKEPPAMAVAAAPPNPDPSPPSRPVWMDWKLTGVAEGTNSGTLAMVQHTRTKDHLTLPVGGFLADAKFVGGGGEKAVFEIAGQRFEISMGETLEHRRPTDR